MFGSFIVITGNAGARCAFYLGADGKRRPAHFVVPDDVADHELCEYLADLYHEHATPRNCTAVQIS
ncbi:hypothetical protein [Rugamonas sp.]|uniref:DUF7661 family protein n=1 Tax=Rugamonas sp. TaxID=1926287 RepID=UPI00345C0D3D